MALSYSLGYQESISVHPTRRQNFAGKPYSNFPNIWEWLVNSAKRSATSISDSIFCSYIHLSHLWPFAQLEANNLCHLQESNSGQTFGIESQTKLCLSRKKWLLTQNAAAWDGAPRPLLAVCDPGDLQTSFSLSSPHSSTPSPSSSLSSSPLWKGYEAWVKESVNESPLKRR